MADGKRAVSGSADQTLRIWDLEGNHPPRVLEGHKDWISAVALTADGKRAVSGSWDRRLRVWDLERRSYGNCSSEGDHLYWPARIGARGPIVATPGISRGTANLTVFALAWAKVRAFIGGNLSETYSCPGAPTGKRRDSNRTVPARLSRRWGNLH